MRQARVASAAVYPALRQWLRSSSVIAGGAITLSFLVMLAASWRRWLSPLTDSGREMDLPLRLLNGELLYRDIHYLYAPFSPYFNALLYRVFGVHLDVLQMSGIAGASLVVFLVYRVARRLMNPVDSAIAAICVIVWLVFKPYGNLISPYAYSALHATIFALCGLLCCLRFCESSRSRELLLAGLLAGLAAVTKLEFAIPVVASIAATLFVKGPLRFSELALRGVISAAPILVLVIAVYGWFLQRVGWETLVVDCHLFYTHLPQSLIIYNAWRAGTDRPLASFAEMLGGLAVCVMIVSAILIAAYLCVRRKDSDPAKVAVKYVRFAVVSFAIASAAAVLIAVTTGGWDGSPLRAAPILLIGTILYAWSSARTHLKQAALVIVAVFSLVMLLRVALRVPSGGPYGGFLLPTTYVFVVYLLFNSLPAAVERWGYGRALAEQARKVARVLVALVLLIGAGDTISRYITKHRFWVISPRGDLRVVQAHSPAYQEALDYLRDNSMKEDRIAVFPEGSDLAFLGERRMPLRHQILLPGLVSQTDETRMIGQLESEPIEFVFIVNRPTREFGASVFGHDYYQRLGDAITRDYHVVRVCGRDRNPGIEIGDREFFIKILKRNR